MGGWARTDFKNISNRMTASYINYGRVLFVMNEVKVDEYKVMDEDFYDAQTKSLNPLRAWFHTRRFELIRKVVEKYYKPGDVIVDLACGNCNWNTQQLPVMGVDVSEKMLQYALEKKRIAQMKVEDCEKNLSLKDKSVSLIVLSEALEHMVHPEKVLRQIHRVLKKDGVLVCTVPFDTNVSLWKPLFKVQCLMHGYVFGNDYYKKECGHVNHFSPGSLKSILQKSGLHPVEMFDNKRFTIFAVARKN